MHPPKNYIFIDFRQLKIPKCNFDPRFEFFMPELCLPDVFVVLIALEVPEIEYFLFFYVRQWAISY